MLYAVVTAALFYFAVAAELISPLLTCHARYAMLIRFRHVVATH